MLEHPAFPALVALLLHGTLLWSLARIRVDSAPEDPGLDGEELATFALDLRTTSWLIEAPSLPVGPAPTTEALVVEEPTSAVDPMLDPSTPVEPPGLDPSSTAHLEQPSAAEPADEPLVGSTSDPLEETASVSATTPRPTEPEPQPDLTATRDPSAAPEQGLAGSPAPADDTRPRTDAGELALPKPDATARRGPSQGSTAGETTAGSSTSAVGSQELESVSAGALRARSSPRPEYPAGARRRGEEGAVTCRLTIERSGRVLDVQLVTSSGFPDLDAAALHALRRWRFDSLERLTRAERVVVVHRLRFELARARD